MRICARDHAGPRPGRMNSICPSVYPLIPMLPASTWSCLPRLQRTCLVQRPTSPHSTSFYCAYCPNNTLLSVTKGTSVPVTFLRVRHSGRRLRTSADGERRKQRHTECMPVHQPSPISRQASTARWSIQPRDAGTRCSTISVLCPVDHDWQAASAALRRCHEQSTPSGALLASVMIHLR